MGVEVEGVELEGLGEVESEGLVGVESEGLAGVEGGGVEPEELVGAEGASVGMDGIRDPVGIGRFVTARVSWASARL